MMKYINMQDLSSWDISMIFSELGHGLSFVWEILGNESVQIYTMTHPEDLKLDMHSPTKQIWSDDISNWAVSKHLEVYTSNISGKNALAELFDRFSNLQVKKGLV